MTSLVFVGVDVAKDRLDVLVRPSGERWSVANDEAGIAAVVGRLRPLQPALIVSEATGGFERAAIAISPAATRVSRAPMVAINCCAAKLAWTACWKCGFLCSAIFGGGSGAQRNALKLRRAEERLIP